MMYKIDLHMVQKKKVCICVFIYVCMYVYKHILTNMYKHRGRVCMHEYTQMIKEMEQNV